MAIYILDSNTLSLLKYGHTVLVQQLRLHEKETLSVTCVSVEEVLGGWYKRFRQARNNKETAVVSVNMAKAVMLLKKFHVWPDTESSLNEADRLVKARLNIGKMDIRIATIALELDATVVTNNIRDFSRVPGLKVVDWSV